MSADIILIADSGSTKTHWVLCEKQKKCGEWFTVGFNPYFQTSFEIAEIIQTTLLPYLPSTFANQNIELNYYGAGCSTEEKKEIVEQAMRSVFKNASVIIEHDLMAAALALCGKEEGIAGILGTGSNSCHFFKGKIVENVPSKGYLFGDHGSGAQMGKKLIQSYFDEKLEPTLMKKLNYLPEFQLENILESVYKKPMPSRYLASFTRIINENINFDSCKVIVREAFQEFFEHQVEKYSNSKNLPVHVVGSVGFYFKEHFEFVANQQNFKVGKVMQSPMQGLIEYHINL